MPTHFLGHSPMNRSYSSAPTLKLTQRVYGQTSRREVRWRLSPKRDLPAIARPREPTTEQDHHITRARALHQAKCERAPCQTGPPWRPQYGAALPTEQRFIYCVTQASTTAPTLSQADAGLEPRTLHYE
jgi:hypothetical protein